MRLFFLSSTQLRSSPKILAGAARKGKIAASQACLRRGAGTHRWWVAARERGGGVLRQWAAVWRGAHRQ